MRLRRRARPEQPERDSRRQKVQRIAALGGAGAAVLGALLDAPGLLVAGNAVAQSAEGASERDRAEHLQQMSAFYDTLRRVDEYNAQLENRETEYNTRQTNTERVRQVERGQALEDAERERAEALEDAERKRQEALEDAERRRAEELEDDQRELEQDKEMTRYREGFIRSRPRSGGSSSRQTTARYYQDQLDDVEAELAEVESSLEDRTLPPSQRRALEAERRKLRRERRDYLKYVGDGQPDEGDEDGEPLDGPGERGATGNTSGGAQRRPGIVEHYRRLQQQFGLDRARMLQTMLADASLSNEEIDALMDAFELD